MTEQLRVAKIISDREVAITGGREAEIKEGDVLLILGRPIEIDDPETGESLGQIVSNKAVVRVFDVQQKFCLARTFRSKKVNVGGTGTFTTSGGIGRFFEPPRYETRTETLRRSPHSGVSISEEESVVEVGDAVEKFEGNLDDIPSSGVWR